MSSQARSAQDHEATSMILPSRQLASRAMELPEWEDPKFSDSGMPCEEDVAILACDCPWDIQEPVEEEDTHNISKDTGIFNA